MSRPKQPCGLIRYESFSNHGPSRLVRWLNRTFGLNLGPAGWETHGRTFDDLARHVTIYGLEPGYRAEVTKHNGGSGLDFYSLDRWRRDTNDVAFTWLTDQVEMRLDPERGWVPQEDDR